MAYSYVKYTGDGSTTTYAIPFTYLSADYLEVKVNDVATTAYTLPTSSSLQFTTAPPNTQIVEIRRNTPKTARLVDFQDASILTEAALDLDSDQAFHVMQETYDYSTDAGGPAVLAAANAAAASEANAAASYDSFDDRYLGAKAADPTLDNDGDALLTGAIYWNTASNTFKAWTGSTWAIFTVNAQPLDATLTALAGLNATAGMMEQTGADAFTKRSIGTSANQIPLWQHTPMSGLTGYSAAYTVAAGDRGQVLVLQGAGGWTLSLPDGATLPTGFSFAVKNEGTGTITIDPFGTQAIDAAATLPIYPGESFFLVNDGAGVWRTVGRIIGIGHSQAWAAATITSGTSYTNSTGKPIMIKADVTGNSGQRAYVSLTINGASVGNLTDANAPAGVSPTATGTVVIPVGATYVLTDTQVAARTNYILS